METPQGVSVQEAAEILGCSANAVRMRIRHKTIGAFKVGNEWRILIDEEGRPVGSDRRIRPTSDALVRKTYQSEKIASPAQSMSLLMQETLRPFIQELGEVREELGRIKTEREVLQQRIIELEKAQDASKSHEKEKEGEFPPQGETEGQRGVQTHHSQSRWAKLKTFFTR